MTLFDWIIIGYLATVFLFIIGISILGAFRARHLCRCLDHATCEVADNDNTPDVLVLAFHYVDHTAVPTLDLGTRHLLIVERRAFTDKL